MRHFELMAKAAAHGLDVDVHLFGVQTCDLSRPIPHEQGDLRACPDLACVGRDFDDGIHRLHRSVREIRDAIGGLDDVCALDGVFDIAIIALAMVKEVFVVDGIFQNIPNLGGIFGIRRRPPNALHGARGLHGVPGVGRNNGDAMFDRNDLLNTRHFFSDFRVITLHVSANSGIGTDGGKDHAVDGDVDPVCLGTGAFCNHVGAFQIGFAQTPPGFRIAQGNVFDGVNFCGICGQRRISHA